MNVKLTKNLVPDGTFNSPNIVSGLNITHSSEDVLSVTGTGIGIDYNGATHEYSVFINNPIFHESHQRKVGQVWTTRHIKITTGKKRHIKIGVRKLLESMERDGYVNKASMR